MLCSGTDPESYITEYTLVYEDKRILHTVDYAGLVPLNSGKGNSNSHGARPVC